SVSAAEKSGKPSPAGGEGSWVSKRPVLLNHNQCGIFLQRRSTDSFDVSQILNGGKGAIGFAVSNNRLRLCGTNAMQLLGNRLSAGGIDVQRRRACTGSSGMGGMGRVCAGGLCRFGGDHRIGKRKWGKQRDRKSTRLNSSHVKISYAVFCLKKKKEQ